MTINMRAKKSGRKMPSYEKWLRARFDKYYDKAFVKAFDKNTTNDECKSEAIEESRQSCAEEEIVEVEPEKMEVNGNYMVAAPPQSDGPPARRTLRSRSYGGCVIEPPRMEGALAFCTFSDEPEDQDDVVITWEDGEFKRECDVKPGEVDPSSECEAKSDDADSLNGERNKCDEDDDLCEIVEVRGNDDIVKENLDESECARAVASILVEPSDDDDEPGTLYICLSSDDECPAVDENVEYAQFCEGINDTSTPAVEDEQPQGNRAQAPENEPPLVLDDANIVSGTRNTTGEQNKSSCPKPKRPRGRPSKRRSKGLAVSTDVDVPNTKSAELPVLDEATLVTVLSEGGDKPSDRNPRSATLVTGLSEGGDKPSDQNPTSGVPNTHGDLEILASFQKPKVQKRRPGRPPGSKNKKLAAPAVLGDAGDSSAISAKISSPEDSTLVAGRSEEGNQQSGVGSPAKSSLDAIIEMVAAQKEAIVKKRRPYRRKKSATDESATRRPYRRKKSATDESATSNVEGQPLPATFLMARSIVRDWYVASVDKPRPQTSRPASSVVESPKVLVSNDKSTPGVVVAPKPRKLAPSASAGKSAGCGPPTLTRHPDQFTSTLFQSYQVMNSWSHGPISCTKQQVRTKVDGKFCLGNRSGVFNSEFDFSLGSYFKFLAVSSSRLYVHGQVLKKKKN